MGKTATTPLASGRAIRASIESAFAQITTNATTIAAHSGALTYGTRIPALEDSWATPCGCCDASPQWRLDWGILFGQPPDSACAVVHRKASPSVRRRRHTGEPESAQPALALCLDCSVARHGELWKLSRGRLVIRAQIQAALGEALWSTPRPLSSNPEAVQVGGFVFNACNSCRCCALLGNERCYWCTAQRAALIRRLTEQTKETAQ